MADIARLTRPQHRLLKSEKKQAYAAKRRAAIDALPAARSNLKHAKAIEKKAESLYYETEHSNNSTKHNNALRNRSHAEDKVDRLERIAAGNYKNTDRLFLPTRKAHENVSLTHAERQAARIQAAKNAREKQKGWLWGGTRRTRRSRKMTRRVR